MSKRKFSDSISGKGYYIALILCAAAIGISGYLYYQNANDPNDTLSDPQDDTTAATQDVAAVATQPGTVEPDPTEPPDDVTEPTVKPGKPQNTMLPVQGETVMEYAVDCLCYNPTTRDWRTHSGIDIAAEEGSSVCAAADGTVYSVYEDETMGMTVVIRHDGGYVTKYASLAQEVSVAPGETVKVGQAIGTVGQTALLETAVGAHVHFSVTCDGEPVDPAEFLATQ